MTEIKNMHVLSKSKDDRDIILIVGDRGMTVDDMKEICRCGRENYQENSDVVVEYADDRHPLDQIDRVGEIVRDEAGRCFIYTFSPFVLQAFTHFTGEIDTRLKIIEASKDGDVISLKDITDDRRKAFEKMASALRDVMNTTERIAPEQDESGNPKYVRISAEFDCYWFDGIEFEGDIYDMINLDEFKKEHPELVDEAGKFSMTIDIADGRVLGWKEGSGAWFTNVKMVDIGTYSLLDENFNVLMECESYVPDFLQIEENGYGDYFEFIVGSDGIIEKWKFTDEDIENTWE